LYYINHNAKLQSIKKERLGTHDKKSFANILNDGGKKQRHWHYKNRKILVQKHRRADKLTRVLLGV
jgi:hypothetical protein